MQYLLLTFRESTQTLFLKRYVGNKMKAYTHTAFLKVFRVVHEQKDIKMPQKYQLLNELPSFNNSSSEIFSQMACLKINLARR